MSTISGSTAGSGDVPRERSGSGQVLLMMLLVVSGLSASLALLPLAQRFAPGRRERGFFEADRRGVGDYVVERLPLIQQRRVELAGVSVACLLIAFLIVVGLI